MSIHINDKNISELIRFIQNQFDEERHFSSFRNEICQAACRMALLLLKENGAPLLHINSVDIGRDIWKLRYDFSREVCRQLSCFNSRFRFLVPEDSLISSLADVLHNRSGMLYDQLLQKMAPEIIPRDGDQEYYQWARDRAGLEKIEKQMYFEKKLDADIADLLVAEVYSTVCDHFSKHLLIFGVELKDKNLEFSVWKTFSGLNFDKDAISKFRVSFNHWHEVFEERGHQEVKNQIDELLAVTPPTGTFSGIIVTPPLKWKHFSARCAEHWGDSWNSARVATPSRWEWLIENCKYIIAIRGNLLLNQAFRLGEFWIRQIAAVSECLRSQGEWTLETLSDEAEMLAACRFLPIPLGECRAASRSQFGQKLVSRNEPSREFEIGVIPFFSQEDFSECNKKGMNNITRLLASFDPEDQRLKKAIECFESACSLGGSRGAISETMKLMWTTAALWTALEVLYSKSRASIEDRRSKLQVVLKELSFALKQANVEASQIEEIFSVVRILYDRRNDAVHQALSGNIQEDRSFRKVVAIAIAAELLRKFPHPAA